MSKNSKVVALSPRETDEVTREPAQTATARVVQLAGGPRHFPLAPSSPRLPAMIPDEILDYYGWLFCQGGFANMEMTFEGFLAVVAAIHPSGLRPRHEASAAELSAD